MPARTCIFVVTGRTLFEPLGAYNEFAARFNGQVFHERLAWNQVLVFAQGMTLRIHGFNSTLLSRAVTDDGQDDKQLSLYPSPWQTALLDPDPNILNPVMAHHPPDWLMDQDEVEGAVQERAAIHLSGHKHQQRINKDDPYIRLGAGAVNPDAGEPGWHPAYNLIELSMQGSPHASCTRLRRAKRRTSVGGGAGGCCSSSGCGGSYGRTIHTQSCHPLVGIAYGRTP